MARVKYEPEFKEKVVRLNLEEGRSIGSLSKEYNINKGTISAWIKKYSEECKNNPKKEQEKDYMKENLKLRKQLEELEKENRFLKKAAAFFAKESE